MNAKIYCMCERKGLAYEKYIVANEVLYNSIAPFWLEELLYVGSMTLKGYLYSIVGYIYVSVSHVQMQWRRQRGPFIYDVVKIISIFTKTHLPS